MNDDRVEQVESAGQVRENLRATIDALKAEVAGLKTKAAALSKRLRAELEMR